MYVGSCNVGAFSLAVGRFAPTKLVRALHLQLDIVALSNSIPSKEKNEGFLFCFTFELLRPREVVCEHLHASADPTVCVRAPGMAWSSSYEGFHVCSPRGLLNEVWGR